MYMLAVDQSTSATKALIFDTSGTVIDKTALDHQQYYPRSGWVEHDAGEIYQNTLRVLGILLKKHPDKSFICLSITNQRETFVVFDKSTGEPLYHAIVWQCRRGEPTCRRLTEAGHEQEVQNITGLKIDTYFPASKITWLLEARPDIRQKLETGQALLGTIETYLIYRLTRGVSFVSDHTNACRTLLYNINTLDWSETLCALFGVPLHALAEVRESSAHFGETDFEGLLGKPIPICGVMGDSQAALFAERCFEPGSTKVTFGTGSSILMNIGHQVKQSANGMVTTPGWSYQGQPTYAFEGIINFTGATIAWMRDQMRLIDSPEETEALAMTVEDNGGVYLVPAFVGLSAPYWQPNIRAAIFGLTPASTKNHIVRAALESIAYQVTDVLELMKSESGFTLEHIHADGGMVNNRFLMQFVADMTGFRVRASHLPELSALGAVMSGMLGVNIHDSLASLATLPHQFTDYDPHMSAEQREKNYTGWKQAVEQLLK